MALAVRKFLSDSVDRLRSGAANIIRNSAEGYRRAPLIQSPQALRQVAGRVQQFNQFAEKYNPIQALGKSAAKSYSQVPGLVKNKNYLGAIGKVAEGTGTLAAPYFAATAPAAAAVTAGFGGTINKVTGGSFRQGAKESLRYGSITAPLAAASNPYLSRIIPKSAGVIGSRVAPAAANVLQGIGLNFATGQKTTPLSLGIDALTGAVGGKSQFSTTNSGNLDEILKKGKALGFEGITPRVSRVHPEDLDIMREFADEILRRGGDKKNLGELGISAQRLAQHYLGGKWRTASNKKLAQAFEWAIDLNMNIPREARGQLPKLGLAEDQAQSVISQLRQPTKGVETQGINTPLVRTGNLKIQAQKPEVRQAVKQQNEVLKAKINALDYFRTPEKVLQKIGLGDQAVKLRQSFDNYQKELPIEIDRVTQWYERVGKSPDASQRIFQYLDGKPISLNGEEKLVADEIKQYFTQWADRLGIPPEKRITNYITHIFEGELAAKEFDPDLEKIIANNVPGSVYDPFLQKRYGVAGYKEDAFAALDAYVKRATRKVNMDPALESLKKASDQLPLQSWNYIKSYADRINMRPTEVDSLIDATIKQSPIGYRFGQRPVAAITRNVRNAVYRGTLGLNVGSALRNLTQGANTYAELGERWTAKGYFDVAKSILSKSNELDEVGVTGGSMVQDRTISATKKVGEKLDKVLFSIFDLAERINRGAAYFGAKARALSSGKSMEQAIKEGIDTARKTQFTFGSIDTPVALQSDIVKSLTQFQSYNIKQAEFLLDKARKKEVAGLIRYAAAWIVFIKAGNEVLGLDWTSAVPFGSTVSESESPVAKTPPFQLVSSVARAGVQGKDKYGNQVGGNAIQRIINDDEVRKAAGSMIIPGYTQLNKSIQGIKAFNRGYSETKSGNIRYPIEKNTENQLKTGLFGQYATKEARDYFDNEKRPLSESQTEIYKSLPKEQGKKYLETIYQERELNKVFKKLENDEITPQEAESLISKVSASENFDERLGSENKELAEKLTTFTKKKVKSGIPVSQKELETAYLSKPLSMSSKNRYEKTKRQAELYSGAISIGNDENLSDQQKEYLLGIVAKEVGITKEQLNYYEIANDDENEKTMYVLDAIEKMPDEQFKKFLTVGRVEINGKMVISNGVIDNLVDEGVLSESQGKALKKVKYNQDGTRVTKKSSGKSSSFISDKEILSAFNNAMKSRVSIANKQTSSRSAKTLADLYSQRRKSFKLK